MKMKKILKAITWVFAGLAFISLLGLMGLTVHDAWRGNRMQTRISGVAVGDSKDHVKQVMGEPNASWDRQKKFMSNQEMPAGFAYGKAMDWRNAFHSEFPFFFPFRFRLFGPDREDIVVEFNDDWIVMGIRMPK